MHTLYDIVRKLPEGAQVETDGDGSGQVTLSAGRSRFSLASLPVDEFPVLSSGEFTSVFCKRR